MYLGVQEKIYYWFTLLSLDSFRPIIIPYSAYCAQLTEIYQSPAPKNQLQNLFSPTSFDTEARNLVVMFKGPKLIMNLINLGDTISVNAPITVSEG